MEKITEKQIDDFLKIYGNALKEFIKISEMEDDIKIKKIKTQKNLLLLREELKNLSAYEYVAIFEK